MSVNITPRTLSAFATGVILAVVTVFVFQAWRVDAAPGDEDSTFVPITPCRLIDSRRAPDRVGPIAALGADDTRTLIARGTNGDCTIPDDAVGLSLNVTAVGASAPTFLTIWPGGALPNASNLNPGPGQPPTPNAVTTPLSATGSFDIYNLAGAVDVIIDVNGYYTQSSLVELASQVATLLSSTAELKASQPFTVTNTVLTPNMAGDALTVTPTAHVSVTATASVDGQVTVTSTAQVRRGTTIGSVACAIYESSLVPLALTTVPPVFISSQTPSYQEFRNNTAASLTGTLSAARTFDIAAGHTIRYSLACEENGDTGFIATRSLSAIFTPVRIEP